MNVRAKIWLPAVFVFFIAVGFVYPQTGQYKFRHLTFKQGLPSNIVNSIIKDSEGFMWFATNNGLARYDGYSFKIYKIPGDSVSNNQVFTKVFQDNDGNLWVGTSGRGLQMFDRVNESFYGFIHDDGNLHSISSNDVNTICQDREGVLWIGTNEGLNALNVKNGRFTSYRPDEEDPGNPKNKVFAIFEDKTGTFWAGTDEGLFLFDREKNIFTGFDFGIEIPAGFYRRINCITEDRNGMLWFGTMWGMFKYDRYNSNITHYVPLGITPAFTEKPATFISNLFVLSIVETVQDDEPVLWIATMWGLNKLEIEREKFLAIHANPDNPQSLSTSSLNNLFLDDAGLLWIGTRISGADILNTRADPFYEVFIKVPDESFSYQPASFLMDNAGTLWIGGTEGGLFQYDKHFNLTGKYSLWHFKPDKFDKRHNNRINCIYENNANTLWLGFYQWGLVLFDKERKTFRQVKLKNHADAPEPTIIENILRDQYGILWVGTDAGLYFRNRNEDVFASAHIVRHDELNKARITNLFEDSRNNLWISTRNSGLYCLKPDGRPSMQFVSYEVNSNDKNGFFGNYAQTVYEDRKGTLWFGSDKGLNKFNFGNEEFEAIVDFNDDYTGHIFRIYGDEHDKLWIYHAIKGLIRYQPYSNKTNKIKAFDVGGGLPFDNFNTIFSPPNSFYQSADGSLFIGAGLSTGHSFFRFRPDSINDNKHIPPVLLTGFNIGNKTYVLDSSVTVKKYITLKHNQNFFSFEFAALDYFDPEKNQYAYYLEGFEDTWNYVGNRHFVNYTGVPPGKYTFHVKGSNNDGYWNEAGTSLAITILPPPWKAWWAWMMYAFLVVSVTTAIIRFYLRRQRLLYQLDLEHIESSKLKELNSIKSRFFANISHEFRTPLTLILGPLQKMIGSAASLTDKRDLAVMQRNARRLQQLINQLLNLSKLEAGKMQLHFSEMNIVKWVRMHIQSFESLAMQKNIEFIFNSEQPEIICWFDPEKLVPVLNNLLSNAFKFTGEGGRIEVGVSFHIPLNHPKGVKISISDTGTGIPPENLEHIFDRFYQADDSKTRHYEGTGIGLALVKELVELHHGTISVVSEQNKGTTFTILLPLGQEHLKPEEITEKAEEPPEPEQPPETFELLISVEPEKETAEEPEKTDQSILLIVEDNADMRNYIRGFFDETYRILEAPDGKQGYETALKYIPDIIISDVMMPVMDGYQLCKKIKTDERTSHIPFILLTARSLGADKIEGLEIGADDFVIKPFDGRELQVRVKNLIEQRKRLRELLAKRMQKSALTAPDDLEANGITSMDEQFLQNLYKTVSCYYSDPQFNVEGCCRESGMSRTQLHRKIKALTGQTTGDFIRTYRLNRAAGLLKKKSATVAEIAYYVGFSSPSYFTECFRKQFGVLPSEFE